MRESRPYGSERGAFSNGRPYRDRTDGHRGRSETLELFFANQRAQPARSPRLIDRDGPLASVLLSSGPFAGAAEAPSR